MTRTRIAALLIAALGAAAPALAHPAGFFHDHGAGATAAAVVAVSAFALLRRRRSA